MWGKAPPTGRLDASIQTEILPADSLERGFAPMKYRDFFRGLPESLAGVEEDDFIWGGGAQRKLRTDHVAARPQRGEEDVPPPT